MVLRVFASFMIERHFVPKLYDVDEVFLRKLQARFGSGFVKIFG